MRALILHPFFRSHIRGGVCVCARAGVWVCGCASVRAAYFKVTDCWVSLLVSSLERATEWKKSCHELEEDSINGLSNTFFFLPSFLSFLRWYVRGWRHLIYKNEVIKRFNYLLLPTLHYPNPTLSFFTWFYQTLLNPTLPFFNHHSTLLHSTFSFPTPFDLFLTLPFLSFSVSFATRLSSRYICESNQKSYRGLL